MAKASAKNGDDTDTKTRGDGPFALRYLDAEGKADHKRVPKNVTGVVFVSKDGKTTTKFLINDVAPELRLQLCALALQKKLDSGLRASKQEDPAMAAEIANKLFAELKNGALYSRGEGGKAAGRPSQYETDMWVQIMAEYSVKRGTPASDEQREALRVKLDSTKGKQRTTMIKGWLESDPEIEILWRSAELQRSKANKPKGKSEVNAQSVLASVFG